MEITLQSPEDVAQHLADRWKDVPRAALESLALEGRAKNEERQIG
jgi:hypothetical protein